VAKKVRTIGVLFVLKHVLLNSVIKLSKKLHEVSNKMFTVSAMSCKQEFREDFDCVACRPDCKSFILQILLVRCWQIFVQTSTSATIGIFINIFCHMFHH